MVSRTGLSTLCRPRRRALSTWVMVSVREMPPRVKVTTVAETSAPPMTPAIVHRTVWLDSDAAMTTRISPTKCFLGVHAAWLSTSPTGGCWSGANGLPICDSTLAGVDRVGPPVGVGQQLRQGAALVGVGDGAAQGPPQPLDAVGVRVVGWGVDQHQLLAHLG